MDQNFRLKYLPQYHERVSGPEKLPDGTLVMTAWFDELPACLAQAATAEEAVERLWDGLPAFLDMLNEYGATIPDAIDPPAPASTSSGTPGVKVTGFSVGEFRPQFATS